MRKALTSTAIAAGFCSLALPAVAQAGPPDTTPPSLALAPNVQYPVGSGVGSFDLDDGADGVFPVYSYSVRWNWKTSDASRICKQTLTYYDADQGDDGPHVIDVANNVRSFTGHIDGYDAAKYLAYGSLSIKVTDCAGNSSSSDLVSAARANVTEDNDASILYRRAWGVTYFSGFTPQGPRGETHYTTERGASFVKTVKGGPVALVMEKKHDRGSAAVYVDGRQVATVNTNVAGTAAVHSTVVWQRVLAPGTHTLRVVNLATPGHARIDLDAILN